MPKLHFILFKPIKFMKKLFTFSILAYLLFTLNSYTLGQESNNNNFKISVSHTTRKPRPNEIDGKEYHIISKEEFDS